MNLFIEQEIMTDEHWEDLKAVYGFEISSEYPHKIRNKKTKNIILCSMKKGYLLITLAGNEYRVHRLIAEQWIPNPDKLPIVDHINGDRIDNHVNNLRWCTKKDNDTNIHYRYGEALDLKPEINEICKPLDYYQKRDTCFYNIYFNNETNEVYLYNSALFKKITVLNNKKGNYVQLYDVSKHKRNIYIDEIKSIINNVSITPEVFEIKTTQGYTIEYLKELPKLSILIKYYNNKKLKLKYWFDSNSLRLIKLVDFKYIDYKCYKYQYIRSSEIKLEYFDGNSEQVHVSDIINQFTKSEIIPKQNHMLKDEIDFFMSDTESD